MFCFCFNRKEILAIIESCENVATVVYTECRFITKDFLN